MAKYKEGDYWFICDKSGRKTRISDGKLEWTGNLVDKHKFESRQPQDFVRAVTESQTVPDHRPRPTDVFTTIAYMLSPSILYLPLDESIGSVVTDDTGNGYNGTLTGASARWESLAEGYSVQLNANDATTDYIALDQKAISFAENEDFCVHVQFTTTDDYGALLALRNSAVDNSLLAIMVGNNAIVNDSGKMLGIFRDDNGAGLLSLNANFTVNNDVAHTVTIRRIDSTISLWVDGIERTSGTGSNGPVTFTTDHQALGTELRWVFLNYQTADDQYLDSNIIWTHVQSGTITDDEIEQIHGE